MIDKFDLQKLQALPIEEVASALGLHVSHHKALCPFHADKHTSLTFHRGKNRYRCFVCDAHGGAIDLVMKYLNKDFLSACRWLASEHSVPVIPVAEPVEAPSMQVGIKGSSRGLGFQTKPASSFSMKGSLILV